MKKLLADVCIGAIDMVLKVLDGTDSKETPSPVISTDTRFINPLSFVRRMDQHWTSTLYNISSNELRDVWYQIASTFNDHISDQQSGWDILSPPTGSGKTEGTVIYCSMLADVPDKSHPGVLIVTRMIKDCDKIAGRINEFGGRKTAVAFHSKSSNRSADLRNHPVLVITHRAYERVLDVVEQGTLTGTAWNHFHKWNNGDRKLIVIDESLDIVEHFQVDTKLEETLYAIPQGLRYQFHSEVRAIELTIQLLHNTDSDKSIMLSRTPIEVSKQLDFLGLIDALNNHWIDRIDRKGREVHEKRLRSLHYIVKSWSYYAPTFKDVSLNSAYPLVGASIGNAVVMDATASTNFIYNIFQGGNKIAPPSKCRKYKHFTLHVSRGHRVGKGYMSKESNVRMMFHTTMMNLAPSLYGKNPLVICHKASRNVLETLIPANWSIGHWGQIDGSNEWKNCDTVIVFGLPYLPDTWAANTYMALQGPQSTTWLNDRSSSFINVKEALKQGMLSTNVIQGINRICTRKVVDDKGNCPDADGFILIPYGEAGDNIISSIEKSMPGVNIVEWDCSRIIEEEIHGIHDIDDLFDFEHDGLTESQEVALC